jgi:hypothetical protein
MDKFLSWLQELRGLLSHPSDLLEFTYSQNGEGEKFGAVNKTEGLSKKGCRNGEKPCIPRRR